MVLYIAILIVHLLHGSPAQNWKVVMFSFSSRLNLQKMQALPLGPETLLKLNTGCLMCINFLQRKVPWLPPGSLSLSFNFLAGMSIVWCYKPAFRSSNFLCTFDLEKITLSHRCGWKFKNLFSLFTALWFQNPFIYL